MRVGLAALVFGLLALSGDLGTFARSQTRTLTGGRCEQICTKLIECGALADAGGCLEDCTAWELLTPDAARQVHEAVQPVLASSCSVFYSAALR